ncbi:histidine kinase [Brachyspira hyodysenteriae]|nr:histidine kinase [Brachyspira hyodysenteriae]MCZ9892357.1 histidine kinase [Brachyspira hyodysenteriae]
MKKNTKTCNLCSNRDTCIQLCGDMKKIIRNKKNNNDIYSDATFNAFEIDLSNVIYTFGLSKLEERDSKQNNNSIAQKRSKKNAFSIIERIYTKRNSRRIKNVSK